MNKQRLILAALALAGALHAGGCAHQSGANLARPELGQPSPAEPGPAALAAESPDGDTGAEAKVTIKHPPRIKPEHDARYHLPPAEKRALNIYLGSQTFEYLEDGQVFLSGPISSGTKEHPTPAGGYRVLSKIKDKRSGKYTNGLDENTPMPYSLQFNGPYFVHEGWVPGFPDSHGCVRLHYEDARLLYDRIRIGDPVLVAAQGAARPVDSMPNQFLVF